MAAPFLVATGVLSAGATAIIPAYPAGWQAGDILLLAVESANEAIAEPAGWTEVAGSPQFRGTAGVAGGVRLGVFWRRAQFGDTAPTVADTGNHQLAVISAFRGAVRSGDPWDVTAGGTLAAGSNATAISLPGVTTTVADTRIVHFIASDLSSNGANYSAQANATLTGITEHHDAGTITGAGGGLCIFSGVKDTAGATGSSTAVAAVGTATCHLTVALKEATSPFCAAIGTRGTSTASATVPLPTGIVADDILVLLVETANQAIATPPTGWTEFPSSPQGIGPAGAAGGTRLHAYWRRVVGGETNPMIPDTGDHYIGVILAFRGCIATGNPVDVAAGDTAAAGSAGGTISLPPVTTTVPGTLVLNILTSDLDQLTPNFSAPANGTLDGPLRLLELAETTGLGGGICVITGVRTAAGATGNTTVVAAAGTANAQLTAALKPPTSSVTTGTGAFTEPEDVISGAGAVAASDIGSGAFTEPVDVITGTGQRDNLRTGSGAFTEPVDVISGTGAHGDVVTGTGGFTEPVDAISGSGTAAITGTGGFTERVDTIAGTGAAAVAGTGGFTEPADAVSGTGTAAVTGTGAFTEPVDTISGTGTAVVAGAGGITEPVDTISGAGTARVTGTGAITEPTDTILSSIGTARVTGTGGWTEPPDTVAGAGDARVTGTGALTEPVDTISGAGVQGSGFAGSGGFFEPVDIISGAGTAPQFLIATGITAPVSFARPPLAQRHAFPPVAGLSTGAVSFAAPTGLVQKPHFTTAGLAAGAVVFGGTALAQRHAFGSVAALSTGPVSIAAAAGLVQGFPLAASGITAPVSFATPPLAQRHAFGPSIGVSSGAVSLAAPTGLAQRHGISALGQTTGPVSFAQPALAGRQSFVAAGLATEPVTLGSPGLASASDNVVPVGITAGAVAFGAPALRQVHRISAPGISAGAPSLGWVVLPSPAWSYKHPDVILVPKPPVMHLGTSNRVRLHGTSNRVIL